MGCGNTKSRQEIGRPQRIQPFFDEKPITHPVSQEPKKQGSINLDQQTEPTQHFELNQQVNLVQAKEKGQPELAKSNLQQNKQENAQENKSEKKPKSKAELSLADRSLNLSQELSELRHDDPKFNFKDGELSPIGEEDEAKTAKQKLTFSEKMNENQQQKVVPDKSLDVGERKLQPETMQLMTLKKRVVIQEPVQIKEVEQKQPEPVNLRPRREKQGIFDWPARGEVQLKTIGFKLRYNIGLKSFKVVKSNDSYTTSSLQWVQDEAGYYECKFTDLFATSIKTGNSVDINHVPIKFVIDINGKFVTNIHLCN